MYILFLLMLMFSLHQLATVTLRGPSAPFVIPVGASVAAGPTSLVGAVTSVHREPTASDPQAAYVRSSHEDTQYLLP